MGFGFSIGDFIAVIGLVNKVRKDFVKATDQFPQICNDLRRLENATRDIDVLLSERQLSPDQQRRLGEIIHECNAVLHDAKKLIDQYSALRSPANGVREKASRLRDRLGWDPDDVRDIQGRINGILESCNFVVGLLSEENIIKLVKGQERQEEREQVREDRNKQRAQQEVLDWLTPLDYAAQQTDLINQREAGTGQWLLDSTEYRAWLSTKQKALFCPGIPGAGKTMLASIVVDNLLNLYRADETIGICYIFLNFRQAAEQTPQNLTASLLKQLANSKSSLSEPLRLLHEKHKKRQTRPSCKELCDTIRSLSRDYARVFMIVDALDEFQVQGDDSLSKFIGELLDFWSNFGVNIFVTSRFIPEITSKFDKGVNKIEIRASNDDITKYMEGKLSSLPAFIARDECFWAEVKKMVVRCVDGMFLLARLQCDALRGQCTRKAVRNTLNRLLYRSDTTGSKDNHTMLTSAYEGALLRIRGQLQSQADLAMQTLMWITFAKRPLHTEELRHALGIELESAEFDVDNLPDLEDMVSYCCGLVAVDEESQIIRLVHYTTQEYFDRTGSLLFPSAQTQIAKTCVTYLNYDAFIDGACSDDHNFDTRLKHYPFYRYASRYGLVHTLSAPDYAFCYKFLLCASKVQACLQALPYRTFEGTTGLHLAAILGLHKAVPVLLRFYETDTADQYGNTPIIYAIEQGNISMVKALLNRGVSAKSIVKSKTLLMHAVLRGTEDTIELPFRIYNDAESKTSSEVGGRYLRRNLYHISEIEIKAMVHLLLESGADVDTRSEDDSGITAIAQAAKLGYESIVRLLLEWNADPNCGTAIIYAVCQGFQSIVRLLVERGADINARDANDGYTAINTLHV